MALCIVWFLQVILSTSSETSTVQQVSVSPPRSLHGSVLWRVFVPEQHHLCLPCGTDLHPTLNRDVQPQITYSWTHRVQEVPPKRTEDQDEEQDRSRFNVRPDGVLCILRLDSSDSGEYYCNERLTAHLQVLKGEVYSVRAGGTLLLPCTASSKPRQRWFRRRPGAKRELLLTHSRDGTVTLAREHARLGFEHDALRIVPLQLEDSGEYQCNGDRLATVVVQTEAKPTSINPNHSSPPVTPIIKETDFVETKTKERKSENVLLVVVMCLGLMVAMVTAVSVSLVSVKCRRKWRHRRAAKQTLEATELQPWTRTPKSEEKEETTCPTPEEEEDDEGIHYASLGRPTWKHRPIQTTPKREHHTVIYSSICTK